MSVIYALAAHAKGGLFGIQSAQRNRSPFLAHLTHYLSIKRFEGYGQDIIMQTDYTAQPCNEWLNREGKLRKASQ